MSALVLKNVWLGFGGVQALAGIDMAIEATGITSLIGPNGAGKTSLVNVITASYRLNKGQVLWRDRDIAPLKPHDLARQGIARTFQNLEVFWTMSVLENVMVACQAAAPPSFLACLFKTPGVVRAEEAFRAQAMETLILAGLKDEMNRQAATLPYGHLKLLEIARAMALRPQILLLDEPAAGCNPRETEHLADMISNIARQGIGVVLVEHDMKLVMRISDRIVVLDRGCIIADGPPEAVRSDPRVIEAYLGTAAETKNLEKKQIVTAGAAL